MRKAMDRWPGSASRKYCEVTTELIDVPPQQIIYRKLIPMDKPDESFYKETFMPRKYKGEDDFFELLERIATTGYNSRYVDPPEYHRLDISVYRPSRLVFQLPAGPVVFAEPAVVLTVVGEDCPDELYGGLRYVDTGGKPHTAGVANCKLIYFDARHKAGAYGNPYRQEFNFKVNPGQRRLITIDPDIRHPGLAGFDVEP